MATNPEPTNSKTNDEAGVYFISSFGCSHNGWLDEFIEIGRHFPDVIHTHTYTDAIYKHTHTHTHTPTPMRSTHT